MADGERLNMYENRNEYHPADLDALEIVTEVIDDILSRPEEVPGPTGKMTSDQTFTHIMRGYNFISTNKKDSWAWPVTEYNVALYYTHNKTTHHEIYTVVTTQNIHRYDVDKPPLSSQYVIQFHGRNREGDVESKMTSISYLNPDTRGHQTETREMTEYDAGQLFDQLGLLYDYMNAARAENSNITKLQN